MAGEASDRSCDGGVTPFARSIDAVQDPVPHDDLGDVYDSDTLAALDAWSAPERPADPAMPSKVVSWSRRSTVGLLATGLALGLQEVFDPPREEQIVIEVDAGGEPHDLPIQLFLDPDDPSGSICILRADPPPPIV